MAYCILKRRSKRKLWNICQQRIPAKLLGVLSLEWVKNVLRRTLCAFVPLLAKPDDLFAKQHLKEREFELYLMMDKRDRDHACEVAKAVSNSFSKSQGDETLLLIRAALLHDIGKSTGVYNPFERVFVHLFTLKNLPTEPAFKGLKGAWQRRQHHAYYGAKKLREAGVCERLASIVEHHHESGKLEEADLLKLIEDKY